MKRESGEISIDEVPLNSGFNVRSNDSQHSLSVICGEEQHSFISVSEVQTQAVIPSDNNVAMQIHQR